MNDRCSVCGKRVDHALIALCEVEDFLGAMLQG